MEKFNTLTIAQVPESYISKELNLLLSDNATFRDEDLETNEVIVSLCNILEDLEGGNFHQDFDKVENELRKLVKETEQFNYVMITRV